jgi:hypothetical protein
MAAPFSVSELLPSYPTIRAVACPCAFITLVLPSTSHDFLLLSRLMVHSYTSNNLRSSCGILPSDKTKVEIRQIFLPKGTTGAGKIYLDFSSGYGVLQVGVPTLFVQIGPAVIPIERFGNDADTYANSSHFVFYDNPKELYNVVAAFIEGLE